MSNLSTVSVATDCRRFVQLSAGVHFSLSDQSLTLRGVAVPISSYCDSIQSALSKMAQLPCDEGGVIRDILDHDGPGEVTRFMNLLVRLDGVGALARSIRSGEAVVAVLRPMGPGPSAPPKQVSTTATYQVSRFAIVRRDVDNTMIIQSPHSHYAVELSAAALTVVHALSNWTPYDSIEGVGGLSGSSLQALVGYLLSAGVIDRSDELGDRTERRSLAQWNLFDLWFHSRIRGSRLVEGWGRTYPMPGTPPLPAEAPGGGGERIDLFVPPETTFSSPLRSVMEQRRSIREHDDQSPITVKQLGEFLYRSARTKHIVPSSADKDQIIDRPYPSGGALHELELSFVVNQCTGLDPGLWHYRPLTHQLERGAEPGPQYERLLLVAQTASIMKTTPQILVIITARFGRVMWKYETIAYGLTLKHVGVLMQTMYLVATDMGLAPCSLGGGDAGSFAELSGLDFFEQGSVGEFLLGSLPSVLTDSELNSWKQPSCQAD